MHCSPYLQARPTNVDWCLFGVKLSSPVPPVPSPPTFSATPRLLGQSSPVHIGQQLPPSSEPMGGEQTGLPGDQLLSKVYSDLGLFEVRVS